MKHVDIFITHNMTSLKARRAAYVYVIYALTSKGDATCSEFGMEQNVTVNRINLYAFCSALAHFTSPAEITVYTDSSVLAGAFNSGNIDKWQKNGFQTARGRPLANADLWRRAAQLIQGHLVSAVLTKQHQYTSWAETELIRKYGCAQ